ncbi:hypothetical protein CBS101457_003355 [Exobasidium rhododendri]|nr:hypothetical protein CBS101457_003355 [Exobasidium rhododendri]
MSLWKGQQAAPVAFASIAGLLILAVTRARLHTSAHRLLEAPEPTEREPYPWNLYEGGATLETPYGKLRLYEMGPKEGKKVLLIHGISQPCPTWRLIVPKLIESGHRILCYDLIGRGYSDGISHLDNDISLFISQLCFLLTSLPDWSGSFNLVGYSLGGSIATAFANYFPHRIDNILLIAPGGLMRSSTLPWLPRLYLSGLIPLSVVRTLIFTGLTPIKFLKVTNLVDWQIKHHQGYSHSYTSTLISGSLADLKDRFEEVQEQFGDRMQAIWGDEDPVCPLSSAKAIPSLTVHVIKGGAHDMLVQSQFTDQIVELMDTFLSSSLS